VASVVSTKNKLHTRSTLTLKMVVWEPKRCSRKKEAKVGNISPNAPHCGRLQTTLNKGGWARLPPQALVVN
jgi:hypothetical protein